MQSQPFQTDALGQALNVGGQGVGLLIEPAFLFDSVSGDRETDYSNNVIGIPRKPGGFPLELELVMPNGQAERFLYQNPHVHWSLPFEKVRVLNADWNAWYIIHTFTSRSDEGKGGQHRLTKRTAGLNVMTLMPTTAPATVLPASSYPIYSHYRSLTMHIRNPTPDAIRVWLAVEHYDSGHNHNGWEWSEDIAAAEFQGAAGWGNGNRVISRLVDFPAGRVYLQNLGAGAVWFSLEAELEF